LLLAATRQARAKVACAPLEKVSCEFQLSDLLITQCLTFIQLHKTTAEMMFALLDETSLVLIPLRVFFSLGNKAKGKQCARFILHCTKPCSRINGKNKNVGKRNKYWDDERAQACLDTKDSETFLGYLICAF
jgi:hypothetical protein